MDNLNLEKMNEVWSRVTGAAACSEQNADRSDQICRFIDRAQKLSAFYTALARKCRAKASAFYRLASDEKQNIRHLQTVYFIMTGDTCAVSESRANVGSLLDALRVAYLEETENADACRRAAIESQSGSVTELFSALADQKEEHGVILKNMISEIIS